MSAMYRGEKVWIMSIKGRKAKIATSRGLRWAQLHELEILQ